MLTTILGLRTYARKDYLQMLPSPNQKGISLKCIDLTAAGYHPHVR